MPTCPRCQRDTHVRGGYWERRQADYWACWWCCYEWETPSLAAEAARLAHEAAQTAQDAVEALEHLERYGLPVIAPLTPGTLRGFAQGGWMTEPVIYPSSVDVLRDRAWWEQAVDLRLRPVLRRQAP